MIRKARVIDARQIQVIINNYAKKDKLLPRSLSQIYENVRDFFVKEKRKKIIGCVALHIHWEDLVEIKSLAVQKKHCGQGYGQELVTSAMEEAKSLGVKKIFALTYIPEFFLKLGFEEINKDDLPKKIWGECIQCVKFPDCGEVPVVYYIKWEK